MLLEYFTFRTLGNHYVRNIEHKDSDLMLTNLVAQLKRSMVPPGDRINSGPVDVDGDNIFFYTVSVTKNTQEIKIFDKTGK